MSLAPGARLGPYRITALIGQGGMGEVWRASDTNLGRHVAIKVLPDAFAQDSDRLARFEREARTLGTLNHQNIASIYGLEEAAGTRALVMELVEGPTLAERIAHGPIAIEEALSTARQIAAALEAAHATGIIHRDLKPANIKVRPDGTVKVLDFGLAKAMAQAGDPDAATRSPTVLSPAPTLSGVVLGTPAYMSPEQARGSAVDARSDVWAFGCVLFEMLAGRRPFAAETPIDAVAAIVAREPDWQALPVDTPVLVRSLLIRCLKKDPAQRLHHIADARFQIEDALSVHVEPIVATRSLAANRRERAAWIASALLAGVVAFLALQLAGGSRPADPIGFSVMPPEGTAFAGLVNTTVNVPSFALSPDGRALVFSAQAAGAVPTLWFRSLASTGARELMGTDGAQDPFWSPDGEWIGFFADGRLKKVLAAGGPVQVITQTESDFRGGTWTPNGTILFSSGTNPILSVDANGGTPTAVTTFDQTRREAVHRNPHMLPDGRNFLYSVMGHQEESNGVYVGSLDGQTKKLLLRLNTSSVYVPPGYLLFADGEALLARAFDLERLELTGEPFRVAEHGGRNTAFLSAVSASASGTIAYADIIAQAGRLEWVDRAGGAIRAAGTPEGDYTDFRLSPDGTRLAASLFDRRTNAVEIWITDLVRNTTARLSPGGLITASAVWSPDGTRLLFRTNRNGMIEFFERSAAGGGTDRVVVSSGAYQAAKLPSFNLVPTDWSPDGLRIVLSAPTSASGGDLWLLPVGDGATPTSFITSPGEQMHGSFSPDGRLVAYTSGESGRFEVYVETFPRSDRKWAISALGGYEPRWRAAGGEIYYLSEDRTLMSVTVGAGPLFGAPRPLFQTRVPAGVANNRTHYVPGPDGRTFLVKTALEAPAPTIDVVVNWTPAP